MSASAHPQRYDELEDAFITDANFKVDISQRMKVPNKISFSADGVNGVGPNAPWSENLNMHVPERILVVGQHQHIGTRAPPREIDFDNSLRQQSEPFPCDPRVATPPRTLTLDKYPFPGIDDFEETRKEQIPVVTRAVVKKPKAFNLDESANASISHRESTPPIGGSGDGLTTTEEVLHLRRQMAKLNRRVMALEFENLSRLQKEKILYGLGIAYFLLKAMIWLNRSSN